MADAQNDPHRFDFDLDRGIRDQVVEAIEGSPQLPLASGVGPPESGIYALYFNDDLVYIGKASKGTTKSSRTLRDRLNEQVEKLIGPVFPARQDEWSNFTTSCHIGSVT